MLRIILCPRHAFSFALSIAMFTASAIGQSSAGAEIQYAIAIAAGPDGFAYVADRNLPGLWKLNEKGCELVFQGSKTFRTPLNAPRCVAFDKQTGLIVGDSSTREIYRWEEPNHLQPLTGGEIGIPMGIAFNSTGAIFVSDLEAQCIWKVAATGGKPQKFAEVAAPRGLAMNRENRLWVVSHGKDQLVRISPEGSLEPVVSGRPFGFPHAVGLDDEQNAYVCDGYAKVIWKIGAGEDRQPRKWIEGKPLENPVGLAWEVGTRTLLIVDPQARQVFRADREGKVTSLLAPAAAK